MSKQIKLLKSDPEDTNEEMEDKGYIHRGVGYKDQEIKTSMLTF